MHGWSIMGNHVHLISSARNENLSDILRDFKRFTSKDIIAAIENKDHESRKEWMLKIFMEEGSKNSRNKTYQFWRQDNQPQELYSPNFLFKNSITFIITPLLPVLFKNLNIIYTVAPKITLKEKNVGCWMDLFCSLFD